MKKLILPLVTVLLLLVGGRGILLDTVADRTSGTITNYEQVIDGNTEAMDHIYNINYAFAVDGKHYSGSYRKKMFNQSRAPKKGASVSIRYFAFAPQINGKSGENIKVGLGCTGIAIALFFFARLSKRKRIKE